ncbi:hypothetical protein KFU94_65175 [Chloroflexi bacterium TSY]|nr:hypothetical protein [Chloroflexi bacterium TSY]
MGRLDYQVKIRGFRIELGEIEAMLDQHPTVQQTVVIDREDRSGNKQLVAYVVSVPEQVTNVATLRRFVGEKLPDYMVPSAFVMLDEVPLTPNGKVNRKALPAPDIDGSGLGTEFVPPRTATEEALVDIWAEVLDVEPTNIGVQHSFFELGGYSLLATQVASRVRRAFDIELELRRLFEAPTIADLSQVVERAQYLDKRLALPPIEQRPRESQHGNHWPLSFAQERLWHQIRQQEPTSADNLSAYHLTMAIGIEVPLPVEILEDSLSEVIERHEILRTTFPTVNGQPVQVIGPPVSVEAAYKRRFGINWARKHLPLAIFDPRSSSRWFQFGQFFRRVLLDSLRMDALRRGFLRILYRQYSREYDVATVHSQADYRESSHLVNQNPADSQNGHAVESIAMSVIDLRHLSEAQQPNEVRRLATIEAERPFNLATGPLIRFTLFRLGPESHVLLTTQHQMISDEWSFDLFIGEVISLCLAEMNEQPYPLSELPVQYADFATWQRQWFQGEWLETVQNYWQTHLAGATLPLELPTDRPRLTAKSYERCQISFEIEPELRQKLNELAQQSDATLYMALMAAFNLLLACESNQTDIVIGARVANRERSEVDQLFGLFFNTLLIRTDFSQNPSGHALLAQMRHHVLNALAHQDMPFAKLEGALGWGSNLHQLPLYRMLFIFYTDDDIDFGHLPGLSTYSLDKTKAKVTDDEDLVLQMVDTEVRVRGTLTYNHHLFDESTIARLIAQLKTLLNSIVQTPDQPVFELSLTTDSGQLSAMEEGGE